MRSNLSKTRFALISLFFCTLFSLSCQKEVSEETVSREQAEVNVYVAGGERDGNNSVAKYWKNGIEVILPSTRPVEIRSIYVFGNDVYVAGWEKASNGKGVVTYWKNNKPVYVTDGTYNAIAFAITVSGNDVYIAGTEGRFENGGYYIFPTYWKNGNHINLTSGSLDGGAFGITVSGNDVYVVGAESDGFGYFATYWKNGKAVILSNPFDAFMANSIAVAGNDVYVAATQYLSGGQTLGKLWKNSTDMNLTNNLNSYAQCVTVSDNDVYVCGSEDKIAKYWKNGNAVSLYPTNSIASSIAIYEKDVYVAGTVNNGTHTVATYWKNGSRISLSDGTKDNYATGIFLSVH